MTLIAELDHQLNPQAIAEILRQELQSLNLEDVTVAAAIVDSNLDLQIRSNSAIDKEKLLTLIHGRLQGLSIESLAKFRIHCWRNSEMAESRWLWSEQFMLKTLEVVPQDMAADVNGARSPEPQLSKNSVLQSAISQIASTNPKMQQQLLALQQENVSNSDRLDRSPIAEQSIDTKPSPNFQGDTRNVNFSSDTAQSYWYLVLVGLSIVLIGLGIGAVVRTLTTKTTVATQGLPASVVTLPSAIAEPSTPLEAPVSASPMPLAESSPVSPIVTLSKFNLVENGMTIEQVEQIFGVTGKVIAETSSDESVGRVYSWRNPEGSNAIIEFKNGQVVAKAQAGL